MTIDEVKAIFTAPGTYCLTHQWNGKTTSRIAFIWGVYDADEYKQVRGQANPVITISDEMILISNMLALTLYSAEVQAAEEPRNSIELPTSLPSDYWLG